MAGVPSSRATFGFPQYRVFTCASFGCNQYARSEAFGGKKKCCPYLVERKELELELEFKVDLLQTVATSSGLFKVCCASCALCSVLYSES